MTSLKKIARRFLPPSIRWRLNGFLAYHGYGNVIDCTQFKTPLTAIEKHSPRSYLERIKSANVLVNVPIESCVSLGSAAFRCTYEAHNPFVCTTVEISTRSTQTYSASALRKFYAAFTPKNAAEYLGLPTKSARGTLLGSPLSAALPWELIPPGSAQEKFNASVVEFENRNIGSHASAKDGDKYFGPVSLEKGEVEFLRLVQLVKSIKDKGYQRSDAFDGDIIGQLMVRNGEFTVHIRSGNHRIAALSALGYKTIPVRISANIRSILDKNRAENWFNVRNGTFSLSEAVEVFDRIFEGRQPIACKIKW